jgi:hypothetical protein
MPDRSDCTASARPTFKKFEQRRDSVLFAPLCWFYKCLERIEGGWGRNNVLILQMKITLKWFQQNTDDTVRNRAVKCIPGENLRSISRRTSIVLMMAFLSWVQDSEINIHPVCPAPAPSALSFTIIPIVP